MTTTDRQSVELIIGGMTCASCAARVEKKLNRMDGVTATVNYATEKAKVTFPDGISTDDLVATVEQPATPRRCRRRPSSRRTTSPTSSNRCAIG